MCKVQMLRALVKQRLTAAAEEIFGLFERTIAEYEEQLCRSKEENERQRKLLDAVYNPQLRLHRAEVQQQLLVVKEEVPPEQQEWSSSVDQEDPEPPHIKEEEEELWSSQEGEQLQGLEEADITKFTFTPVPVKSEDDEEKPQSEGHHCGGPGPSRPGPGGGELPVPGGVRPVLGGGVRPMPGGVRPVLGGGVRPMPGGVRPVLGGGVRPMPGGGVRPVLGGGVRPMLGGGVRPVLGGGVPLPRDSSEPDTDDETRDPVVAEIEVSVNDWKETREPQLGLNSLGNNDVPVSHLKRFSCSECGKSFGLKATLKKHLRTHTGEKPFSCIVCEKSFTQRGSLQLHLQIHTGEKPFGCVICDFKCRRKSYLQKHMRTHTGEKPFSCSVCGQRFTWSQQAKRHTCANRQPSQLHQTQPEQSRVAEPLDSTSVDGNRS